MKIVGYVRQTPGRADPDTAFAQSERVRRWVADTANELIAMCQDHHTSSAPTDRPGFKALLDIARSGDADAVVIASLDALSPDKITQEIMIQDLQAAGVALIATDEEDIVILAGSEEDHARIVVRDILARVGEYREAFGLSRDVEPSVGQAVVKPVPTEYEDLTDVVIELIAPSA